MKIVGLGLALCTAPLIGLGCGGYFYSAPPTLDNYPERLPVKTMRELLRETEPPAANRATFEELLAETRAIADALGNAPREELLQRIETTLARNRAGDYRKRFANCLFDLADLLAIPGAPGAESIKYADWRSQAMDRDDGFFTPPPDPESWRFTPAQIAGMRESWLVEYSKAVELLTAEAAKASPGLKPHWQVQVGALQFKHCRFDEAGRTFAQVIEESPQHPRAEIARLMLARTQIEQWRLLKTQAEQRGGPVPQEVWQKYRSADESLSGYLVAYPHGRFAPDIAGWRAGLARDNGYLSGAISLFLEQVDLHDHPEVVRRAVRECEACFEAIDSAKLLDSADLDQAGLELPLEKIARRPLAALALVYHFLDSQSRHGFEELLREMEDRPERDVTARVLPPVLRMRRAGRDVLPLLAKAVAAQKAGYNAAVWQPKYLAILAWAASEAGEQGQALRVCELAGPALGQCDDLVFVRAVALQRAGKFAAAIEGFRGFQQKFPQSALNAETSFRIATLLRDQHEAGAAAVEFLRMSSAREPAPAEGEQESGEPAVMRELHLTSETEQWASTLLLFAPLAELERGLAVPGILPEMGARLRGVLRRRHLAREDFAGAARFAAPDDAPPVENDRWRVEASALEGEDWRTAVAHLESLTRAAGVPASPAQRAANFFALAGAWEAFRGRLTDPMVANADDVRNARVAGFSPAVVAEELQTRDELHHAFRRYLQAADAEPGTALAARALWLANEAIRKMAEVSPWAAAHAFESNAAALSRQLHDRLLRECPASDEARGLSVWWSFPPPAEMHWMPGNYSTWQVEVAVADAFREPDGKRRISSSESPVWQNYPEFDQRLNAVAAHAFEWESPKLLAELASIRSDLVRVMANARADRLLNHLDDLALFLQEPGLTGSVRTKYFIARLDEDPPEPEDPAMAPWKDYLTFLSLVRERGDRPMSARMREFLEKFPQSRKREAALARLAIATVRESHGHTRVENINWPAAPTPRGYVALVITPGKPLDGVFGPLDAYQREFPHGRYSAEMRLWRGVAALDAGDWKSAVSLLVATLDDSSKRDLHLDAALNLGELFMRLLDKPETRPGIIAALRGNPSAQRRLHQFMHSETPGARLVCLEGFLNAP